MQTWSYLAVVARVFRRRWSCTNFHADPHNPNTSRLSSRPGSISIGFKRRCALNTTTHSTMSTPPSTPKRRRLNRDTRRDILLLRKRGDTYAEIARFLDVTERAVQYTCTTKNATPKHQKAGRPAKLTSEEVDKLVEFVNSSKRTRRLPYQQLKNELNSMPIERISPRRRKWT
jgi:hypothetical protein